MSSDSLLNTPKSKLGREVIPLSPGLLAGLKDGDYLKKEAFARRPYDGWDYIFFPFNKWEKYGPGILSTIHVAVMIFVGSLLNGWLGLQPLANGAVAGANGFFQSFVVAIIQGSLFFLATYWTYEEYLPTYVYPEIALVSVFSGRLGLVVGLGYCVIQYVAYACAGWILDALNPALITPDGATINMVVNTPTIISSYWLYMFAIAIICFNWIYNREFVLPQKSGDYRNNHAHEKAAFCSAVTIGLFIMSFWNLGLRQFSSGMYLSALIFQGIDHNPTIGPVGGYAGSAFFIFVPLLSLVIAGILYLVISFLVNWRTKTDTYELTYDEKNYEEMRERKPVNNEIPYTPMASDSNSNVTRRGLKDKLYME